MSIFHLRYSVWVSYSPIPISHHIYPIPMQRIAIQSIFVIPIDSTCSQLVLDSVWGVDNLSCTEDFYCSFIATRNNCLARRQTLRPPILLFGHIVQQNGIVLFALADESFSSLLSPHSHKQNSLMYIVVVCTSVQTIPKEIRSGQAHGNSQIRILRIQSY